jgi:hypothetical protein
MGDALSKITNTLLNVVASSSLLLLVYSLFILRGIQPQGYTINIYEQLPFSFYLTLLFCYLSACVLLLAYRKISAVLLLFLVHITIMITPYMLGYVSVGRGDEFSYMGLAGDIGLSGLSSLSHIGPLFVSVLALISGMQASALYYFLPVFFSFMFVVGMLLFYRVFMSREKLVSVSFLSSMIPYFGHFQMSTSPYYLSFCLVPLYLFVMRNALSGKNRAMVICLLLMIPLIPLADPFIFAYVVCFSVFLIISLRSLKSGLLNKIMSLSFLSPDSIRNTGRKVPVFIFLSLTSGVFLFYAKYAPHFFDILFPTLSWHTDTIMTTGLFRIPGTESNFFEFIHLFNLHYGKYYIPLIFILINTIIVWQNRKRFCHHFVRRYPRFLAMYIFTFFLELAFLLNPFIPYPPDRFANLSFIIFAQIPLMGYSLYVIFLRKGYTLGLGSALMILCLLWTLGFFTCLSSPYTGGVSEGVSQNEVEGIHWLSEVRENYPYIISSGEEREISAVSGNFNGNYNLPANYSENSATPVDAFTSVPGLFLPLEGADENEPFYLVVTTFSQAFSQEERKHNEETVSYKNILSAYNANKIYDSLNIEIYEHRP